MSFVICTIGCGGIANSMHGPAYLKYARLHPDTILAACCDINEDRAREFQKKFCFQRFYTHYTKMLQVEKPDAVCLITPDFVTADVAYNVINLGFPVLIEKPPGRNSEETLRIIDAVQKKRIIHQVAFNRRSTPLVRELKRLINVGFQPNDIQNIRYDFFRIGRKDFDFSTTAIHGIDTVRYITGSDYRYIRFHYQKLPYVQENVVNIFMDCELKSGATAQLNFCPSAGVVIERATVNCYNNTYFLNIPIWGAVDSPGCLVHVQLGEIKQDVSGREISDGTEVFEESGFFAENEVFFDAVKSGIQPECDLVSALQSVEVADCIRMRKMEYQA